MAAIFSGFFINLCTDNSRMRRSRTLAGMIFYHYNNPGLSTYAAWSVSMFFMLSGYLNGISWSNGKHPPKELFILQHMRCLMKQHRRQKTDDCIGGQKPGNTVKSPVILWTIWENIRNFGHNLWNRDCHADFLCVHTGMASEECSVDYPQYCTFMESAQL